MKKERLIGIGMMAFGAIMCFLTSQITIPGWASAGDIGSRFFPYFASVGLILCGLGVLLSAKKAAPSEPFMNKEGVKRIALLLLVLIVYIALMSVVGFLIASPILLYVVVTMLAGEKNPKPLPKIIFSVVTTGVIYILFVHVLSIVLPTGMLF